MEASLQFRTTAPAARLRPAVSFRTQINIRPKRFGFSSAGALMSNPKRISLSCSPIRAQRPDLKEGPATPSESNISEANALKIKEWEVQRFQDEVAANQGIMIWRRLPTGPPLHYVGPFEFRLQNEGNTPQNILEEIVWNKDKEVSEKNERRHLGTLKQALEKAPPWLSELICSRQF